MYTSNTTKKVWCSSDPNDWVYQDTNYYNSNYLAFVVIVQIMYPNQFLQVVFQQIQSGGLILHHGLIVQI